MVLTGTGDWSGDFGNQDYICDNYFNVVRRLGPVTDIKWVSVYGPYNAHKGLLSLKPKISYTNVRKNIARYKYMYY